MTAVTEDTRDAATVLPRLLPPPGDKAAHDWQAHVGRHGGLAYRDRPGALIGRASCRERVFSSV